MRGDTTKSWFAIDGVYTHFDSFLPPTYKFSMIYTLVFRCFSICSNWTNFHNELNIEFKYDVLNLFL